MNFFSRMLATARPKAQVCGGALAGIVGSSPTGGMDVSLLCVFVLSGRGLCDGQIPRPGESYRMWCVWVWSSKKKNKKPRHLLWVGRIGKDYETKLNDACHLPCLYHSCWLGDCKNVWWKVQITKHLIVQFFPPCCHIRCLSSSRGIDLPLVSCIS
jgi:hypothetical protein